MKKTARRTDITIIVVLALLAVFIVLSIGPWNKPASTQSDPLPLESYNGKTLGGIPGGLIGLTGGAGGAVIGAVVGGVTGAIVGAFD